MIDPICALTLGEQGEGIIHRVKYWEIIADRLEEAVGWSFGLRLSD
jgi:hypothetical protein